MYCIAQDLFWFPAGTKKPDSGRMVLVSGGIAKWDGMYWYSMTGEDAGKRIRWDVKGWAEFPKIPEDFRNEM